MLDRVRNTRDPEPEDDGVDPAFTPLQLAAAQLLLLTGVGAALDSFARRPTAPPPPPEHPLAFERPPARPRALATALAPALVGPLAAAAHLKRTRAPSAATTLAGRILDGAAVGAGMLGLADGLLTARRSRRPPGLASVALAASGVLGLLLDRQSRSVSDERSRLERRAEIVQRLVPRRRARLDHVVIHV